jgi:hypothetical protein
MSVREVRVRVRRVYNVAEYESFEFVCEMVDQPESGGSAEDTAHALFGTALHAIQEAVRDTPTVMAVLRSRGAAVAVTHKVNGKQVMEEGQ